MRLRMILYTFFVGFIFALIVPFKETVISEEFKPYYNDFVIIVKEHCTEDQYFHPNFKIEFQKLYGSFIGECLLRPDRFIIYIDFGYWNRPSFIQEDKRYSLIVHEALHCHFNEPHSNDPNNIMYYSDAIINDKKTINQQLIEILKRHCNK